MKSLHLPPLLLDTVPDPAVRDYLRGRRNWFALLVAVIMTAITWPVLSQTHEVPAYVLPVLALAASLPLAVVFAGPAAVRVGWAVVAITGSVSSLIPHPGVDFPMPIPMFLCLLVMTVAALCTQAAVRIPVIAALTAGAFFLGVQPEARIGWIFALVVIAILIAFVRYRVSPRREIERHTSETEYAQAREAVLAERTRIARELHDVVAHRMSMVVVMSQTAKYRLAAADRSEEIGPGTDAEFAAIADAARQSLNEVRQLLGVLRPADGADTAGSESDDTAGAAGLRPVQGVDDLSALVDSVRAAGVGVDYSDHVGNWGYPSAAGTAVYRIVQESLTNAARHAPGSRVVVTLDRDGDDVVVSVVNSAPERTPVAEHRGGHGLIGMRERAAAVGGSLTSGETDGGGFEVTARIPLRIE